MADQERQNQIRKEQLRRDIADLEATIRGERADIANKQAALEGMKPGSDPERRLKQVIENLKKDIAQNESQIRTLRTELSKLG